MVGCRALESVAWVQLPPRPFYFDDGRPSLYLQVRFRPLIDAGSSPDVLLFSLLISVNTVLPARLVSFFSDRKKWGQGPLSRYLGLPHPSPAARITQDLGISDSNLLGHRSPAAGTGRGQLVATRELTPLPRVY